jgi:hypothetical protein
MRHEVFLYVLRSEADPSRHITHVSVDLVTTVYIISVHVRY